MLASGVDRGVAVPPVLVDLTEDGVKDILVSVFDGQVLAFDGKTCSKLWRRSFQKTEFYRYSHSIIVPVLVYTNFMH